MLFEKNIEIFSDPNPSVLCVFSICLPPFRGWRPGAGREAGSWQGDAIRNLVGIIDDVHMGQIPSCQGVFSWMARGEIQGTSLEGLWHYGQVTLNAAASVPTAAENRPVNVAVPTILYLGIPA
jgi:hypothetical protein